LTKTVQDFHIPAMSVYYAPTIILAGFYVAFMFIGNPKKKTDKKSEGETQQPKEQVKKDQ